MLSLLMLSGKANISRCSSLEASKYERATIYVATLQKDRGAFFELTPQVHYFHAAANHHNQSTREISYRDRAA